MESSPATANNADRTAHDIDSALDSIGMTRAHWTTEQMAEVTRRVGGGEPAVDVLEAMAQQTAEEPLSDPAQILLEAEDKAICRSMMRARMKYTSEQHLNRAQAKRAAFKAKDETDRAALLRLSKVHRGLARAARAEAEKKTSPPKQ